MSFKTVNEMRKLKMHKTPKFVLWVLSDIADENGYTGQWASSTRIQEETSFSNRAVADSIAYLVACGVMTIEGGKGRLSKYQIDAKNFNDQVKYEPKSKAKPVSAAHSFNASSKHKSSERGAIKPVSAAHKVVSAAQEVVSDAHAIHLSTISPIISTNIYTEKFSLFLTGKNKCEKCEKFGQPKKPKPLAKPKKPKPKTLTLDQACSIPLPTNVDLKLWTGYIEMRHAIKKPPTDNAVNLMLEDLADWGLSANQSLKNSIINSWSGLFPVRQQANQNQASKWDVLKTSNNFERDVTPPKKSNEYLEYGHA